MLIIVKENIYILYKYYWFSKFSLLYLCIDEQKYILNGISETCVSDFNYSKEEFMEQLNH